MLYKLAFHPLALKEWNKLDSTSKAQLKKKLSQILLNPKIPKNQLRGYQHAYKIKLKQKGIRLVYQVLNDELLVFVVVIGRRENNAVYKSMNKRIF